MKRRFHILFLLLGAVVTAKAQIVITTPYEYAYGISGGATFSSVIFSPKILQDKKTAVVFGITGRMNMGENMGMQLELNYAQQGWKERYEDEDGKPVREFKYSRLINYIQLPYYTRVQFGIAGDDIKGFIVAGPQIGYMIGESTKENLNGATPGKVNIQHTMPVVKKFEWGIGGGGGIEIRTGIGFFLLEGRYFYSLGDLYNTRHEDPFSKASGQTVTAKISYLIPVKPTGVKHASPL